MKLKRFFSNYWVCFLALIASVLALITFVGERDIVPRSMFTTCSVVVCLVIAVLAEDMIEWWRNN